tara:strand:- start:326 stop:682 length:357 start_codon:yes stop_codon:yes gene_type:complete
MCRVILFICLIGSVLSCTNLDDKHSFRYEIDGAATTVDNMRVKMGPGVDFDSEGEVDLPVNITHEIYGEDLVYFFEIENADQNADINLKVFIDDQLIEANNTFDLTGSIPTITISGIY